MRTKEILTIFALIAIGFSLLSAFSKKERKVGFPESFIFIAIVLLAIGQYIDETENFGDAACKVPGSALTSPQCNNQLPGDACDVLQVCPYGNEKCGENGKCSDNTTCKDDNDCPLKINTITSTSNTMKSEGVTKDISSTSPNSCVKHYDGPCYSIIDKGWSGVSATVTMSDGNEIKLTQNPCGLEAGDISVNMTEGNNYQSLSGHYSGNPHNDSNYNGISGQVIIGPKKTCP